MKYCPDCRRRLWIVRELSQPNTNPPVFWYYCAHCRILCKFKEILTKSTFAYREGLTVQKMKRASLFEEEDVTYSGQRLSLKKLALNRPYLSRKEEIEYGLRDQTEDGEKASE